MSLENFPLSMTPTRAEDSARFAGSRASLASMLIEVARW